MDLGGQTFVNSVNGGNKHKRERERGKFSISVVLYNGIHKLTYRGLSFP